MDSARTPATFEDQAAHPTVDSLAEARSEIAALKRRVDSFRGLVENARDMIWRTDPKGRVTYVNAYVQEFLGRTPTESLGLSIEDYFSPQSAAQISKGVRETLLATPPASFFGIEVEYRHRNGSLIPGELRIFAERNPAGQVVALCGVSRETAARKKAEEALRESESRFDQLAAQSRVVAWEVDARGLFTYLSRVCEFVFGYRPDELVGKTHFYDLHPESGREAFKAAALAVFDRKESFHNLVNTVQTKDGGQVWVSTNGIPLLNTDGTLRGYRGSDTDITERKLAEEARQASEGVLRAFIDSHADMVYLKDSALRHILANPALCRFFGRIEGQVLGKCDADLMPQAAAEHCNESDNEAMRTRSLLVHEEPVGDRFYETRKFTVPLGDGSLGVGAIIRDVTERKRADETLRQSEARLLEAQALSHVGNWEIDLAAHTMWASAEAFRIYGLERTSPFLQLNVIEKISVAEDRGRLDAALRALVQTREPYDVEFRIVRANDQSQRVIHSVAHLVFDVNGAPTKVIGVLQDITESKQAEDEKARLEAQLQQAQKMESVGRLAGGVAHDFNNMLGVILGNVDVAIEQVDPSLPLYGDLREIKAAARRSAELTRQLLAFARKQTVSPRVLDLNETVEGMLKMLQRLIGESIKLDWQPDANLWPVKLDPSQIDQILANLCVNARDAIPDVGTVTIETSNSALDEEFCCAHAGLAAGQYVQLSVSDDGSGMHKETLAHLFEPFFTTKVLGKGTGLGLATVYGIVKQNNGCIDVSSELDRGTTFRIYLPRHVGKARPIFSELPSRPVAHRHETILVVEDEPAILKVTTRMLKRQGYAVLAAETPGEAIQMASALAGEIDLLITDVVMPEMNGRDLARNLLALYPAIKRLFMSGYTADVIAHHGVLDYGVFFIAKPFSEPELAAKVREALDQA